MLTAIGAMKVADPAEWEKQIRTAMKRAKGRIPVAATELGVSTRTLFRWLSEPPLEDVPKALPSLHATPKPAKPKPPKKPRAST